MAKQRRTLAKYGPYGQQVRVFVDSKRDLVRVRWTQDGQRKTRSWDDSRENRKVAKAFAETLAESRVLGTATKRLTVGELWTRYKRAEFPHLSKRSRELYNEKWRKWGEFIGASTYCEDVTMNDVDRFREKLTKVGIVQTQQQRFVQFLRQVFRWGERRELLGRNRVELYRFKTWKNVDNHVAPTDYTYDEYRKILTAWNPDTANGWRPWVITTVLGTQGARVSAALHLKWNDVDTDNNVVTWRAEWDKVGNEWEQPLLAATRKALAKAMEWREQDGYEGPWVFYSPRKAKQALGGEPDATYTLSAYEHALRKAEDRVGVKHMKYRLAHGFRRMASRRVADVTGSGVDALHFIGDKDLAQGDSYLKRSLARLQKMAKLMDEKEEDGEQAA